MFPDDFHNLMHVAYKDGNYWLYHSKELDEDEEKNNFDYLWHSMFESNGSNPEVNWRDKKAWFLEGLFEVVEGDIIKLGRVRFKVAETFIDYNDDYNIDKP